MIALLAVLAPTAAVVGLGSLIYAAFRRP